MHPQNLHNVPHEDRAESSQNKKPMHDDPYRTSLDNQIEKKEKEKDTLKLEGNKRPKRDDPHRTNLLNEIEKKEKETLKSEGKVFQLANYYFVFQGVVLGAILKEGTASGPSSSIKCKYVWLPISLSIIAAVLNLGSLIVIALRYVESLDELNENIQTLYRHDLHEETKEIIKRSETELIEEIKKRREEIELIGEMKSVLIEQMKKRSEEKKKRGEEMIKKRKEEVDELIEERKQKNDNKKCTKLCWLVVTGCLFVAFAVVIVVGMWLIICRN